MQIVLGRLWKEAGKKGFQHWESGKPWRLAASEQGRALAQSPMFSPFLAELPGLASYLWVGISRLPDSAVGKKDGKYRAVRVFKSVKKKRKINLRDKNFVEILWVGIKISLLLNPGLILINRNWKILYFNK